MKLSLKWLKEFVDIPEEISAEQLGNLITLHSAEVDSVENPGEELANMVVGKILELHPHPNADKLQVTITDIGSKKVKIVCGGSNLFVNQLVAVALPGSKVRWHGEGELITLEATTIRGEDSYGMICASSEIGMGESKGKEIMDLTYLQVEAGTPLDKALEKDDILYDIDNKAITHRPDLWSHYGFAREIAALTGGKLKPIKPGLLKTLIPPKGEEINLKITNPEIVTKWNSIIINNIEICESPDWIKNKLESIGARPVNNIVDITNLVMYELGQPLHAYDKNLLGDLNCEIRFAKKGEKLKTIDHKERELNEQDPVLVNQNNPIIVLGIMGGLNSEISESTTSILLESANFDPVVIRKSSTYHGLRSDASQRFEKSLDQNNAQPALFRAIELILEVCPNAKIAGPITEITTKDQPEISLELRPEKINKYLGFELPTKQIVEILESLEFKVSGENPLLVKVPSFRATKDVLTEVDLIEEVVRMYGYDKIEEITPNLPAKSPILNNLRNREHQARNLLKGFGLSEVLNYSFYSLKNLNDTLLNESQHLTLQNYLSEDQTHLRTTLVVNVLKNVHENLKNYNEVKIFEIGRTYTETGAYFPAEEDKIAITVAGIQNPFNKLKGILEAFLEEFGHQNLKIIVAQDSPTFLHPKKSIQIVDENNNQVGFAGIIHPLVQENYDLKSEVAYAEINFAQLMHTHAYSKTFTPIAKYQSVEFDLSVVISDLTYSETIYQAIVNSSELIYACELFDIYTGDQIPLNHKALAYKIKLRSEEKTLSENEINQVRADCINNILKIGGEIRGHK